MRLIIILVFLGTELLAQSFSSSSLPIVVIDTRNRPIINEPKVAAHMGIVNNSTGINLVTGPFNDWDGEIGIELRGSSSQFLFDKKGYGIELKDTDGTDSSSVILGMGKEEDWVLHGPYSDKSLIRNVLAFHLWEATGRYGSATRWCELVINGDYRGVYVMMEKVKRDGDRVDITRLNENDNNGDEVTGGYIVKLDKFDGSNSGEGFESKFPPPLRSRSDQVIFFQYDYPKGRNISDSQEAYIESYVDAFEQVLAAGNFKHPVSGYRRFIDVGSFIDFTLLNEITRNVDGYRLSTFLHKDRDSKDGRLKIGPPWDFNLAFGNADYCDGWETTGWAWDFNKICNNDFWLIPFWWNRFLQDEGFISDLTARWLELRSGAYKTDNILAFIDDQVSLLEQPQLRNRMRWPEVDNYIWPNAFVGGTYENDVNFLKSWITERLEWLDQAISNLQLVTATEPKFEQGIELSPNPFLNTFTVKSPHIIENIRIFNLKGSLIWDQELNQKEIILDLSGYPFGVYLVRIQNAGNPVTRVLIKE